MDTLTVSVVDGVARIQIGSDWLWVLGVVGWLGLYSMWCAIGDWWDSLAASIRRARILRRGS